MKTALLVAHGFLGDNIFISSVAKKLIEERQFDAVDFMTNFPQMFELLEKNPYIRKVYMADIIGPELKHILSGYDLTDYTTVFTFQPFTFAQPPAIEAQIHCGVLNPTADFHAWTVPEYDERALSYINALKKQNSNKKVIAWMRNWEQKSYKFTEHEYWNAEDNYFTGYGKKNRDINYIIEELSKEYIMIPVGVPETLSQMHTAQYQHEFNTFAQEASVLKYCDYFIGAEGGLANLAAAVNCKTLLTYEFIWQCYGPRGTVRPFTNGAVLGPVHYFSEGHAYLPLYKTDDEIIQLIIDHCSTQLIK